MVFFVMWFEWSRGRERERDHWYCFGYGTEDLLPFLFSECEKDSKAGVLMVHQKKILFFVFLPGVRGINCCVCGKAHVTHSR